MSKTNRNETESNKNCQSEINNDNNNFADGADTAKQIIGQKRKRSNDALDSLPPMPDKKQKTTHDGVDPEQKEPSNEELKQPHDEITQEEARRILLCNPYQINLSNEEIFKVLELTKEDERVKQDIEEKVHGSNNENDSSEIKTNNLFDCNMPCDGVNNAALNRTIDDEPNKVTNDENDSYNKNNTASNESIEDEQNETTKTKPEFQSYADIERRVEFLMDQCEKELESDVEKAEKILQEMLALAIPHMKRLDEEAERRKMIQEAYEKRIEVDTPFGGYTLYLPDNYRDGNQRSLTPEPLQDAAHPSIRLLSLRETPFAAVWNQYIRDINKQIIDTKMCDHAV